jgi:hypothetical protein
VDVQVEMSPHIHAAYAVHRGSHLLRHPDCGAQKIHVAADERYLIDWIAIMVCVSQSGRKSIQGNGIECSHNWFVLSVETVTDFEFVIMRNSTLASDPTSIYRKTNCQVIPLWASSFDVEVG